MITYDSVRTALYVISNDEVTLDFSQFIDLDYKEYEVNEMFNKEFFPEMSELKYRAENILMEAFTVFMGL